MLSPGFEKKPEPVPEPVQNFKNPNPYPNWKNNKNPEPVPELKKTRKPEPGDEQTLKDLSNRKPGHVSDDPKTIKTVLSDWSQTEATVYVSSQAIVFGIKHISQQILLLD